MKIKDASNSLIIRVARYYMEDDYITLQMVAEEFGFVSGTFVSNLLFRGVSEDIIDDRTTKYVIEKIVYRKDIGIYQRKLRWEVEAMALRNEAKERKLQEENEQKVFLEKENKQAEIELLKYQIEAYEDFFFDDEGAPTKEELIDKLKKLQ